jgi:phospholipase C
MKGSERRGGRMLRLSAKRLVLLGAALLVGGSCAITALRDTASVSAADAPSLAGIHKIRHVIWIMQENRSFDNYFGTYPGADS